MIGFNKSYQKRFTKKWTNRQIGAGTAKRQPRLIKLKSKKSKKRSSLKKKYSRYALILYALILIICPYFNGFWNSEILK